MPDGVGVFVQLAGHAGDIDEAPAVADERQEVLGGFEGAVVVYLQGLFDDVVVCNESRCSQLQLERHERAITSGSADGDSGMLTETLHGDSSIVDDKVNPLRMLLLQELREIPDTGCLGDVELMVSDFRQTSVLSKDLGLLQLGIVLNALESFFAPALVPCREVYEERAIVES